MRVETEQRHLEQLALSPGTREFVVQHKDAFAHLITQQSVGTSVAPKSGEVLGVVGIVEVAPRVGEVFLLRPDGALCHVAELVKDVCSTLAYVQARFDRIQAAGDDTPLLHRWLSWCGFECEGPDNRAGFEGKLMWRLKAPKGVN